MKKKQWKVEIFTKYIAIYQIFILFLLMIPKIIFPLLLIKI